MAKEAEKKVDKEPKAKKAAAAVEEPTVEVVKEPKATAKAGKRSAKAVAETEAKAEKEERKAKKVEATPEKPKKTAQPARSKLERAGKKYREAAKLIETGKVYNLADAVEIIAKASPTKFDGTVEMHLNLNVDPKQADQNIREMVALPAGSGKNLRIAVFAEADEADKAKKAGADLAGIDEILQLLDKEEHPFDVLIATPQVMAQLGKHAKSLGPKGLMPSPKSGTVTNNTAKAVTEAKTGRVEYRVDAQGIIHLAIGKVSFGADKINQNAQAVMASVKSVKPASVKGVLIESAYLATTMGPSVRIEV